MPRRIVAIGLLVLGTLLLLFCGFRSTMPIVAAQSTSGMGMGGGSQPATYMLSGGFWRTDGAFISTIRVKNVLVVGPMDVIPTLFMADGTPYVLPSVHIPTSGVATININDALAAAPASMAAHLSPYGTAMLMWTYTSAGHVAASIASIDATRSLSYVFSFTTPMGDPMQQTVDGLWWKHDPNVSGFVAVSNTGDAATQATIQLVGPGVETQPARPLYLGQHSTELFRLEDLATNVAALAPQSGGVRVQYTGAMGSVQVVGGLENDTIGYSANIPFWLHDTSASPPAPISYAFAGLMLGKPDPAMMPGFPKGTAFSPYLALRNTTEKPLDVSLQLNYMAGAAAVNRALPAQHLAPLESRQMDLQSALIAAGLKNFNGSINLSASFTGKQGDLVLASGSVDKTGTYVFEVGAKGIGKSRIKFSNYWTIAEGNDTMITLLNPASAAQDIVGTFYFGDGSGKYTVAVHLAPQASAIIDLAMLVAEGKPDASGNTFPPNIREGSAQFASASGNRAWMNLVIASATYNVTIATCGENCVYCCGDSGFGINPGSFDIGLGDTMGCATTAVDCNGVLFGPTSWASSNTAAITVDSSGTVSGVGVGSAEITASWTDVIEINGQVCFEGGQAYCPTGDQGAGSSGTALQVQITTVNLTSDQVSITLNGPSGTTGTLQVVWNGPSGNSDIANTNEGLGSFTFNPPLSNLVTGQYTGVIASWNGVSDVYNTSFYALGNWRHSQYNTPNEAGCVQAGAGAYLVNSTTCAYQSGTLKSDFISQSWLNGSGITIGAYYGYSTEQNAAYCVAHNYLPSDANGKSFAFVPQFTPGCGSGYSLNNSTVAYNTSDANVGCGDQVLIVGLNGGAGTVKTVTDYCPACSASQLDNYTTQAACAIGSFSDLGNFETIRVNR